jgi:two-component system, cell cycle response regulator
VSTTAISPIPASKRQAPWQASNAAGSGAGTGAATSGVTISETRFLARLVEEIHAIVSLSKFAEQVLRILDDTCGFDTCQMALIRDHDGLIVASGSGPCAVTAGTRIAQTRTPWAEVLRTGRPVVVPGRPGSAPPQSDTRPWTGRPSVHAPIVAGRRRLGVLSVYYAESGAVTRENVALLARIGRYVAGPLGVAQQYGDLKDLAGRDSLTGLANRRILNQRLSRELARARRYGTRMSVVMIEIDGFKAVNDRYGHGRGDEALQAVATVLNLTCREMDVAARLGGDEFVLVLPHTEKPGAAQFAERVREAIAYTPPNGRVSITGSFGVASFPEDGTTADGLLQAADRAMYEAKRAGGNRVARCLPDTVPARGTPGRDVNHRRG